MTTHRIFYPPSLAAEILDLPRGVKILSFGVTDQGDLIIRVESEVDLGYEELDPVYGEVLEEGVINLAGFEPRERR